MTADGVNRALAAPQFDVVLRGYDRRQVDDYVADVQRELARMRADLEAARSQPFPVVSPPGGVPLPPGARPRPTPRPRPIPPGIADTFSDRMKAVLSAAEEEAAEIRRKARAAARAEEEKLRAELADLVRQRDAVLAELTRLRGQLEGLLSSPTARVQRPVPAPEASSAQQGRPAPHAGAPARPADDAPRPAPSKGAPGKASPGPTADRGQGPHNGRPVPRGKARAQGGGGEEPETSAVARADGAADRPQALPRSPVPPPEANRPAARSSPASGEPNSMRPRGEPPPEPAELSRPATDRQRESSEPMTTAVPAAVASNEPTAPAVDRTSAMPARPAAASEKKPDRGREQGAGVDETTKATAAPPRQPDAPTVLAPTGTDPRSANHRGDAKPEQVRRPDSGQQRQPASRPS